MSLWISVIALFCVRVREHVPRGRACGVDDGLPQDNFEANGRRRVRRTMVTESSSKVADELSLGDLEPEAVRLLGCSDDDLDRLGRLPARWAG